MLNTSWRHPLHRCCTHREDIFVTCCIQYNKNTLFTDLHIIEIISIIAGYVEGLLIVESVSSVYKWLKIFADSLGGKNTSKFNIHIKAISFSQISHFRYFGLFIFILCYLTNWSNFQENWKCLLIMIKQSFVKVNFPFEIDPHSLLKWKGRLSNVVRATLAVTWRHRS